MKPMIFSTFSNKEGAENAINQLRTIGADASIIMKDNNENVTTTSIKETGENTSVGDSALSGAATGGVLGAVAGLLIGVGAIAIPGIGGILIGGPVAAALGLTGAAATTMTGAITGALAGGLVGALVGLGVPEDRAKIYEERVKAGNILIAVESNAQNHDRILEILKSQGADEISEVNKDY